LPSHDRFPRHPFAETSTATVPAPTGDGRTTVKHGEIGKGPLRAMLKQLNINPDEF
jgi:hypothetical protein